VRPPHFNLSEAKRRDAANFDEIGDCALCRAAAVFGSRERVLVIRVVWIRRIERVDVLERKSPIMEVTTMDTYSQAGACEIINGYIGVEEGLAVRPASVHPRVAASIDVASRRERWVRSATIRPGETSVRRE